MKKKTLILCFAVLFQISYNKILSQTKMYIASKVVNKSVDYGDGRVLEINAEAADIKILENPENKIQIKLILSAKNKDKEQARRELKYLQYFFNAENKTIYLSNKILINNKATLKSLLKASYEIKLPQNSNVVIKNVLGNIFIRNFEGNIDIETNYGNIDLWNYRGNLKADINIGDLIGKFVQMDANIATRYSVIKLEEISGNININSQFGQIFLLASKELDNLKIISKKTEIFLLKNVGHFNLSIKASYGAIEITDEFVLKNSHIKKSKGLKGGKIIELEYKNPSVKSKIEIFVKFADIHLN